MAPVVHDKARALDEDAVAARVLADEVGHHAAERRLDHFDFLVGAGRHGLKSRVGLARSKQVLNFTTSLLPLEVVGRAACGDELFGAHLYGAGLVFSQLLLAHVVLGRYHLHRHCGNARFLDDWSLFLRSCSLLQF